MNNEDLRQAVFALVTEADFDAEFQGATNDEYDAAYAVWEEYRVEHLEESIEMIKEEVQELQRDADANWEEIADLEDVLASYELELTDRKAL